MIAKLLIWMLGIVAVVYITGAYPTAALVVMGLGIVFMFLLFKDVS